MKTLLISSVLAAALLAACSGQVPQPTSAHAARASQRWPGTTPQDLVEGRQLFVQRCSGCHTLPRPLEHRAEEWPRIMEKMTPLVHMKAGELQKVERYLVVVSER